MYRLLIVALLCAGIASGCASSNEASSDQLNRRVYAASLDDVTKAALKAVRDVGLSIDGSDTIRPNEYVIRCMKESQVTSGGQSGIAQVASVDIFVRQISDKETAVKIETSFNRRSGSGLAGTSSQIGLKEYDQRILRRLDRTFEIRENLTHQADGREDG